MSNLVKIKGVVYNKSLLTLKKVKHLNLSDKELIELGLKEEIKVVYPKKKNKSVEIEIIETKEGE